jgi:hypothetical protein
LFTGAGELATQPQGFSRHGFQSGFEPRHLAGLDGKISRETFILKLKRPTRGGFLCGSRIGLRYRTIPFGAALRGLAAHAGRRAQVLCGPRVAHEFRKARVARDRPDQTSQKSSFLLMCRDLISEGFFHTLAR